MQTAKESTRADDREGAIADTVARVREIESTQGVSPQSLEAIKGELMKLATRTELFPVEDFPPPEQAAGHPSCLYLLSEDDDHRFALYANSTNRRYVNAPHNHTTWAVIVGVHGEEPNRLYKRTDDGGVEETGMTVVKQGTGVAFMPDELHSLDIPGGAPMLNFHMYGLAIPQLFKREYYNAREHSWHYYPPHTDIRDARTGSLEAGSEKTGSGQSA
ncbi:MAG: cysteine dioxygenase [Betaproteobacteria bacterium]|nr:MAG: cysteine dioxygenase [Betaproteobacteria bacterium]